MDNLNIFNDSAIILNGNIPKKIVSWITILFIFVILVIILSLIPFHIYKSKIGYIDIIGNNSYIVFKVDDSDFPVDKNNILYIKDKKYNYKVAKVETDKLVLQINLSNNLKIQNNIVMVNMLKTRTTIFKIFKNKIKKGFGL